MNILNANNNNNSDESQKRGGDASDVDVCDTDVCDTSSVGGNSCTGAVDLLDAPGTGSQPDHRDHQDETRALEQQEARNMGGLNPEQIRVVSVEEVNIPLDKLDRPGPLSFKKRTGAAQIKDRDEGEGYEVPERLVDLEKRRPRPIKRKRGRPPTTGQYINYAAAKKAHLELQRQEMNLQVEREFLEATRERRELRAQQHAAASAPNPMSPSASASTRPIFGGGGITDEDLEGKGRLNALRCLTDGIATVREVAKKSSNLKGTYIKGLKTAASSIDVAARALASISASDETLRLERENAGLAAEVNSLRGRVTELEEKIKCLTEQAAHRDKTSSQIVGSSIALAASTEVEEKKAMQQIASATKGKGKTRSNKGKTGIKIDTRGAANTPLPDMEWENMESMDTAGEMDRSCSAPVHKKEEHNTMRQPEGLEEMFSRLTTTLTSSLLRQTGDIMSARLAAIEHRLLPEKALRPSLKSDKKEGEKDLANMTRNVKATQVASLTSSKGVEEDKKGGKGKDKPEKSRPRSRSNRPPVKRKEGVPSNANGNSLVGAEGRDVNNKVINGTEKRMAYAEVLKKGRGRSQGSGPNPINQIRATGPKNVEKPKTPKNLAPLHKDEYKRKEKIGKKGKKKANRNTAAVMISKPLSAGEDTNFSLAEVMNKATGNVDLKTLDIPYLRPKRAVTGGLLLEIPGNNSASKADVLAQKLVEILGDEAKISRPSRQLEIRVAGLDESATSEKVAEAIAREGGCKKEEVRVAEVRKAPNGLFATWARCPLKAANRIADDGSIMVGWVRARVTTLNKRPLQCHRCLEFGHTRQGCKGPDRSSACYRCGEQGHTAAKCTGAPCCMLCRSRGKPAMHRMGGPACSAPTAGPKKGAKPKAGDKTPPVKAMRALIITSKEGKGKTPLNAKDGKTAPRGEETRGLKKEHNHKGKDKKKGAPAPLLSGRPITNKEAQECLVREETMDTSN